MKIIWIKQENDNKSFKLIKNIGINVINLKNPEDIDDKLTKLINKKYDTFILSYDIAGFSEDIIKKYQNNENINIIITKRNKI